MGSKCKIIVGKKNKKRVQKDLHSKPQYVNINISKKIKRCVANMSITYMKEKNNRKMKKIEEMAGVIFDMLMEEGRGTLREKLEETDEEILKSRDIKRYRCKGKRKTAVKTKLGTVEYMRRIYLDIETNRYVYMLDEEISTENIGIYSKDVTTIIEQSICTNPYREVARMINEMTGLEITHQAVWKIVQELGKKERATTERMTKLNEKNQLIEKVETKILYEEADGDWLKLQGKDREKHGKSREMKIGIAYDGVKERKQKGKKIRRELDNKVAFASFEVAEEFNRHKEAVIASKYNTDVIELRVKNGDGERGYKRAEDCNCITMLDPFHRNKKINECVSDKRKAETLYSLLHENKFDILLDCIEAYINTSEDEKEIEKLKVLYNYYSENKEALTHYLERGIEIPPTREPGVIHHARMGSMESNVFTLIGNRMKGGRACWSINGGNNLAIILCKHYTNVSDLSDAYIDESRNSISNIGSCGSIPLSSGKGYEYKHNVYFNSNFKWLKNIANPLLSLSF